MAALASAADIPPGGEGAIKATVSTAGRSGRISKSITVETNDPDNSVVRLRLSGEIIVEAELDPRRIALGQVSKGESVTKTAVLKTREPGKVRLTDVEVASGTEGLSARLTKVDGVDAVEVTLAGKASGRIRGQIKVGTTSTKQRSIDLWVSGEVVGTFELLPRVVSFAEPAEGEPPAKRSVKVRARVETRHNVTGARDPEGNVSARIQKSGDMWELLLTLDRVPESRRGTLEITTDDPAEPRIQARYFVRRAGVVRTAPARPQGRPPRRAPPGAAH